MKTVFQLLVAFGLVLATVSAASFCELGGMKITMSSQSHSCCGEPAKDQPAPAGYSDCCALSAAPVPATAFAPAVSFVALQPEFWLTFLALPSVTAGAPQLVLEPPWPPSRATPFVAFVLRRSLQAHAPPSFVA